MTKKTITPSQKLKQRLPDIIFVENIEEARKKEINWEQLKKLAREIRNTFSEDGHTLRPKVI